MWLASATLALTAGVGPASAQDTFIDQANALYADVPMNQRSDRIVLPALAKLETPPGVVAQVRQAMLFPADAPGWDAVVAWTTGAPQKAVLDALAQATAEKDPRRGMAFAQAYGQDAGFEALSTGLYTDLGDPPLLAAARHFYLPALDDMACLVHAETTRLAAAGQPMDSLRLLVDWLFFCRQIADRELFDEASWGYLAMIDALERFRDVIYVDSQEPSPHLTASDLKTVLDWGEDRRGALEIDRLQFPRAESISFEQLLDVVYTTGAGGRPNPDTYAPAMARLSAKERPLQLFSAAAWWQQAAPNQAGYIEMRDQGRGCYRDWADNRWRRDYHDAFLKEPSHFETLDLSRFAMLVPLCTRQTPDGPANLGILEHLRQRVLAEIVGTRTTMAIVAYTKANNRFPPVISSLVPEYLPELEADPYNPNRARGATPPLEYFVPWTINDRRPTERDQIEPHEINIVLGSGVNFKRLIGTDQFVLYSVGPSGGAGKAINVQNSSELNPGDYLVWPPVPSLHRQFLAEQGQFR